jgi:hypothetical protein
MDENKKEWQKPELIGRVSSILGVDEKLIRQPSKIRSLSEARGIISYIGGRELGYRGLEVGRELNLGAAGVSVALRRGESILRERPGIKEKVLQKSVLS